MLKGTSTLRGHHPDGAIDAKRVSIELERIVCTDIRIDYLQNTIRFVSGS